MKFRLVVEVNDNAGDPETLQEDLKEIIETPCDYFDMEPKVLDIVRVQEHKEK